MSELLIQLTDLISRYKLYENAIVFNGRDDPYIDLEKCKPIYEAELQRRVRSKIQEINESIDIAEEESNEELRARLIDQRKKVRCLLKADLSEARTVNDLQFPNELLIDHSQFGIE